MAKAAAGVSRMLKDDLKTIKGVGPALSRKLIRAGLTTYVAVSEMKPRELSVIIGGGTGRAQEIIDGAAKLVG
jgi:predicted flap endonuclease-1-like 5' DNA nuclease